MSLHVPGVVATGAGACTSTDMAAVSSPRPTAVENPYCSCDTTTITVGSGATGTGGLAATSCNLCAELPSVNGLANGDPLVPVWSPCMSVLVEVRKVDRVYPSPGPGTGNSKDVTVCGHGVVA